MLKKLSFLALCIVMIFSVSSCGRTEKSDAVSLNKDEKELLEMIDEDIHVIADDDYAQTVPELVYHLEEYSGQVYQLEGVYSVKDGVSSVYRTLVNGDDKTVCSLPLRYVQKDIQEGSWVKVTGVIDSDEEDNSMSVLEVVAIETLPKEGQAELSWAGEVTHQH